MREPVPAAYPPTSRLIAEDSYSQMWRDEKANLFIYLRTAPTESIQALKSRLAELNKTTESAPADACLVLDVRQIPGNNDRKFERVLQPAMAEIAGRFARVACVTSTFTGGLQAQRVKNMGSFSMRVTTSLNEAYAYCRGEDDYRSGGFPKPPPTKPNTLDPKPLVMTKPVGG